MSRPKEIHPWQLVMFARRTTQRRYYLRPGKDTRELFGYLFVKGCIDHACEPVVASLMSNHVHAMLLDVEAKRSKWAQQVFSNTARKRNLQLGRRENLWSRFPGSDMAVLDVEKAVEQVIYTALQPVAAGLVDKAIDWTGFKILPSDWGKPISFTRPAECGETMPETVEIVPMPPPGFEHLPLEDVIAFFEAKITEKEAYYRKKRKGRPVTGIELCEALNPNACPRTKAKMGGRNPRFTTSDPKLAARANQRLKMFTKLHRQALNAFRGGNRDAEFPAGTIQMARLAGCCCAIATSNHALSLRTTWSHALQSSWDAWILS